MKKMLVAAMLLLFVGVLAGCGSKEPAVTEIPLDLGMTVNSISFVDDEYYLLRTQTSPLRDAEQAKVRQIIGNTADDTLTTVFEYPDIMLPQELAGEKVSAEYIDDGCYLVARADNDPQERQRVWEDLSIWQDGGETTLGRLDGGVADLRRLPDGRLAVLSGWGVFMLVNIEEMSAARYELSQIAPIDGWLWYEAVYPVYGENKLVVSVGCEDNQTLQTLAINDGVSAVNESIYTYDDYKEFRFLGAYQDKRYAVYCAEEGGAVCVCFSADDVSYNRTIAELDIDGSAINGGCLSPDGAELLLAVQKFNRPALLHYKLVH